MKSRQFYAAFGLRTRCSSLHWIRLRRRWDRADEALCPQNGRAPLPGACQNSHVWSFSNDTAPARPACCRRLCWNFRPTVHSAGRRKQTRMLKMSRCSGLFAQAQAAGPISAPVHNPPSLARPLQSDVLGCALRNADGRGCGSHRGRNRDTGRAL